MWLGVDACPGPVDAQTPVSLWTLAFSPDPAPMSWLLSGCDHSGSIQENGKQVQRRGQGMSTSFSLSVPLSWWDFCQQLHSLSKPRLDTWEIAQPRTQLFCGSFQRLYSGPLVVFVQRRCDLEMPPSAPPPPQPKGKDSPLVK